MTERRFKQEECCSRAKSVLVSHFCEAGVAQPVEQLICNQRVGGSNPFASSTGSAMAGRALRLRRERWSAPPCPAEQGEVPEWLKGADCKSAASWLRRFESSPLHQVVSRCAPRCRRRNPNGPSPT